MKKLFVFVLVVVVMALMSGCFLVPDKVSARIGEMFAPPPGYIPYSRVDVFNNVEGTYMVLSDRGGTKPERIPTGSFGWVPQNTFFASDGHDYIDNNVITCRFYDSKTDEYLGLVHYQIGAYGSYYQAFHASFERKELRR